MNGNNEEKICSKCGKTYTGYSAISRKDNKTEICSDCGKNEAFEEFAFFQFMEDNNR